MQLDGLVVAPPSEFKPSTARMSESLRRGHFVLLVTSVVVVSFAAGIALGLSNRLQSAHATKIGYEPIFAPGNPRHIMVPENAIAIRVGDDMVLNGSPAEMVHIVSQRGVVELLTETVHRWERKGLRAVGLSSPQRGMAIAVDPANGNRYTALIHLVPPAIRSRVSSGYPTQGYLSYVDTSAARSTSPFDDLVLPSGTVNGGVIDSRDVGGRSTSAFFTLSMGIGESMEWFRLAFQNSGWRPLGRLGEGTFLTFGKDGRERTALFTAVNTKDSNSVRTLVFVVERNSNGPDSQ